MKFKCIFKFLNFIFLYIFRADLYHDEEIQQLLKYRPEWDDLYDETLSDSSITTSDDISKNILLKFNKTY